MLANIMAKKNDNDKKLTKRVQAHENRQLKAE